VYGGKISIIHLLLQKVACEKMFGKVIMYMGIGAMYGSCYLMVKAYIAKSDVWDEFITFSDPQSENPPPPAPCDSSMFRFMIMFASCFALLLNCL
jgi:hypothetical protein